MKLPTLPSRISTHASNKEKHPGLVDLVPDRKPRRTEEEIAQACQEAKEEQEQRTKALKDAASIEDNLVREDEQRDQERTCSASIDTNAITTKHTTLKSKKYAQNEAGIPTTASYDNEDSDIEERPRKKRKCKNSVLFIEEDVDERPRKKKRVSVQEEDDHDDDRPKKKKKVSVEDDDYDMEGSGEGESSLDENTEDEDKDKGKKTSRDHIVGFCATQAVSGTPVINNKRKSDDSIKNNHSGKNVKKGGAKSALLPGWEQNKNRNKKGEHKYDEDEENAEDDNNIVKYGGFVREGENDEVEGRAAKKEAKKLKDENMIKIVDNQVHDERRQRGEKTWTTKHLPSVAAKDFEDQVVPIMRMKAGLLPPWELPSMKDLQDTMDEVFGEGEYKVTPHGPWWGLLNTRLNGWRRSFVDAAEGSIKQVISEHAKDLDTTGKIAELMAHYLSKTSDEEDEESRVFHWKDVDPESNTKSGFLASDLITRTLGIAYLSKFPECLTDFSESKPVGALVLATQAVEYMLEQWTTGCLVKTTKKFSTDNYKNQEVLIELPKEPGMKRKMYARRITSRTDFFTENIEVFKEHHWRTILDDALRLMPEKLKKKRCITVSKVARQDNIVVVEAQSDTRCRRIVVDD